jgi:sigma-E factor negative regulatory protein RseA
MTIKRERSVDRAEVLSALADGELAASEVAQACAEWRDDPQVRGRWHEYQLIGDVLRSEDLASTAAHDSAFLRALRERLDAEPVVLAPAPLAETVVIESQPASAAHAAAGRRRAWFVPSAVAATLAAVVVGGVMTSRQPSDSAPVFMAKGLPQTAPQVVPVSTDTSPETPVTVIDGRLIRDARLDRYLAAHQQWSGGSVVGGHATYLRQASVDGPQR